MDVEQRGETLLFRTGPGHWYNQPHDQVWDLGEDVQDLPPAPWHVALASAIREADPAPRSVVVDATAMWWLAGQDWGFLLRLAKFVLGDSGTLVIVGSARVRGAVALLGLDGILGTSPSVDAALEDIQGNS